MLDDREAGANGELASGLVAGAVCAWMVAASSAAIANQTMIKNTEMEVVDRMFMWIRAATRQSIIKQDTGKGIDHA